MKENIPTSHQNFHPISAALFSDCKSNKRASRVGDSEERNNHPAGVFSLLLVMRFYTFFLFLVLKGMSGFSQKHDVNWAMGMGYNIFFDDNGSLVVDSLTDCKTSGPYGCISTSNGLDVIFLTNDTVSCIPSTLPNTMALFTQSGIISNGNGIYVTPLFNNAGNVFIPAGNPRFFIF